MSDPIVSRLDRLHDQWVEFALLPDARILRWLLAPDELRMIETFLEMETDDRAGELPDLFITCAEPFADTGTYGTALRAGLIRQYEDARPGMEGKGLGVSWVAPPPAQGVHSLGHFIDSCASFRAGHSDMECLALVLLPAAVSDYAEWQRWLRGAAMHLPPEVRLVVVDDLSNPALEPLAAAEPVRVHSVEAGMKMSAFLGEMARMGGTAGPDGQFRVLFTAMTGALANGRLDEAGGSAQGALKVAGEQGWLHLIGAVHFAMAAGFMNAGSPAKALGSYHEADAAGKRLTASDEPLGSRLRLTAAFGVGSVLLGTGQFARAAAVYEVAAPMAARLGDAWLLTDSWRMAAYCNEQAGATAAAWEQGFRALAAAEGIPAAERASSTIPFIREGLVRLAGGSPPHLEAVEQKVAALLGSAPTAASTSAGTGG